MKKFIQNLSLSWVAQNVFFALLFVFGALYLMSLPNFVQGGDTGELVAAAYRLLVPHPPGYPLWICLQHVWIHVFQTGSVYWRASVLNMFFALGTLFCIGFPLRKNPLGILTVIPVLGLARVFSENAILPDVFALHGLFVAIIGSLYLFVEKGQSVRIFGIPFFFLLALANHQTSCFLVPVVFSVFFESFSKPAEKRLLLAAVSLGLTCLLGLYAGLIVFHPESQFSWSNVHDLKSILHHVFRLDYGLFKLAPNLNTADSGMASLKFFLVDSLSELAGLIGCACFFAFLYFKNIFSHRLVVWGSSCLLSIGFLCLVNIVPEGMGAEVLLRFHLMPVVQIVLLCGFVVFKSKPTGKHALLGFSFVLPFLYNQILNLPGLLSIRNDSSIQDYSANFLSETSKSLPTMIFTQNETTYFGIRYLQLIDEKFSNVFVAVPNLFFNEWYLAKVRKVIPNFRLARSEKVWGARSMDLENDLMAPNVGKVDIFVESGFQDSKQFHLTYLPVGRKISIGSGVSFISDLGPSLLLSTRFLDPPVGPQGFARTLLYSNYSNFYLAEGLEAYRQNDESNAILAWSKALEIVPFSYSALSNLCRIRKGKDSRCSVQNLEKSLQIFKEGFF